MFTYLASSSFVWYVLLMHRKTRHPPPMQLHITCSGIRFGAPTFCFSVHVFNLHAFYQYLPSPRQSVPTLSLIERLQFLYPRTQVCATVNFLLLTSSQACTRLLCYVPSTCKDPSTVGPTSSTTVSPVSSQIQAQAYLREC